MRPRPPLVPRRRAQRIQFSELLGNFGCCLLPPEPITRVLLVFNGRPLRQMPMDVLQPVTGVASLQRYPGGRVTSRAHHLQVARERQVGHIGSLLQSVPRWSRFRWSKSLNVRQVTDQCVTIGVSDLNVVDMLHPEDGHQPTLR